MKDLRISGQRSSKYCNVSTFPTSSVSSNSKSILPETQSVSVGMLLVINHYLRHTSTPSPNHPAPIQDTSSDIAFLSQHQLLLDRTKPHVSRNLGCHSIHGQQSHNYWQPTSFYLHFDKIAPNYRLNGHQKRDLRRLALKASDYRCNAHGKYTSRITNVRISISSGAISRPFSKYFNARSSSLAIVAIWPAFCQIFSLY